MTRQHGGKIRWFSIVSSIFLCSFLWNSCRTSQYLGEGQHWMGPAEVSIPKKEKVSQRKSLEAGLLTVVPYKPNSGINFLFWNLPNERWRVWWFFKTNRPKDTTRLDRWARRVLAEAPLFYDSTLVQKTAQSLEYFLQNKGYFNAKVRWEPIEETRVKTVRVKYTASPGKLFVIDTVKIIAPDSAIQTLLEKASTESNLVRGAPVAAEVFDKEAQRIIGLLQNNGYALFGKQFIKVTTDSTGGKHQLAIQYEILPPAETGKHQTYTIGDVVVRVLDKNSTIAGTPKDTLINGVEIYYPSYKKLLFSANRWKKSILLTPGSLFSLDRFNQTNLKLNDMDIVKFVNYEGELDTFFNNTLNYTLRITPKDLMETRGGLDFDYSRAPISGTQRAQLFGTSLNLGFTHRNFFRQGASFSADVRGNIQFLIKKLENYKRVFAYNTQSSASWATPDFVPLFGIGKKWYERQLENRPLGTFSARSVLVAAFNTDLITNWYNLRDLRVQWGYNIKLSKNSSLNLGAISVTYYNPQIGPELQSVIESTDNQLLRLSFEPQLITGFLFKDLSYTYINSNNLLKRSFLFRFDFEQSGSEILGMSILRKTWSPGSGPIKIFNDLDFAQYLRLEANGSFTQSFLNKQQVAIRANAGIIFPFGPYAQGVPFIKQYSVGGPNSLRGWTPRALGPGTVVPVGTGTGDQPIFIQTGNLKFEVNAEYRFPLFYYLNGAIYLDAGNVWNLKDDPIGGKITNQWPFQLAMNTGFGLRLDLNYFVIRWDVGIKLRSPYVLDDKTGTHWFPDPTGFEKMFNWANIAVGYPF